MSKYWKQSLWIGGIYWVISLAFWYADSFEASMIDLGSSILLLLFLIPMKWLAPIKNIDTAIAKAPIVSTFLVFVGWVPYFNAMVFFVTAMAALLIALVYPLEYLFMNLFNIAIILEVLRKLAIIVSFIAAALLVLVFRKSAAGCLGRRYRLIGGDSCDARVIEPAAAASAKSMYACKAAAEKREADKTAAKAKVEAKEEKPAVEKTVKKTVKKTVGKKINKGTTSKTDAAKAKKVTEKSVADQAIKQVKADLKKKNPQTALKKKPAKKKTGAKKSAAAK